MTTAELTAQINRLPLADQRKVSDYVKELLAKRKTKRGLTEEEYFPKLTKEDFIRIFEESRRAEKEGRLIPYEQAMEHWRKKYGLPA